MTADERQREHHSLLYQRDEEGRMRPVLSEQYVKNHFGDLYDERLERIRSRNLERLRKESLSPVEFYRELLDMTDIELAARTGLGRRRVRRHLRPDGFPTARVSELVAYAEVFGVPVYALFCFPAEGAAPSLDTEEGEVPWAVRCRGAAEEEKP